MANILDENHLKYFPTLSSVGSVTLPKGNTRTYDNTIFHTIQCGSDQLTLACAKGAIELRSFHAKLEDRLEGVMPKVEDCQARMILLKILWNRLNSKVSVSEKGTMYLIRNLIYRSNVPLDPEKTMKAAEDLMLLLLHAHMVASAKEVLEYEIPDIFFTLTYVAEAILTHRFCCQDMLI